MKATPQPQLESRKTGERNEPEPVRNCQDAPAKSNSLQPAPRDLGQSLCRDELQSQGVVANGGNMLGQVAPDLS